jgi:hypothetical protein
MREIQHTNPPLKLGRTTERSPAATNTNPEQPEFAEFLRLARALPPDRRAAFAAIAAALALPAATPPNADAELLRLCADFDRLERAWWDLHDGGADPIEDDDERQIAMAPLKAEQDPIAALIWATPAQTVEGIRAKARSWLLFSPEILVEVSSWDDRFTVSIIRDLLEGRATA